MINLPEITTINLYALLPLAGLFANLILAGYIFYRDPRARLNKLYCLATCALAGWSLGNFLEFTAATAEGAVLRNKISIGGACLTVAFLLHFFLTFSQRKLITRKLHAVLLYLPALFFITTDLTTNLITRSAEPAYWGYFIIRGELYLPMTFYIVGYTTVGLVACYKFYLKSRSKRERAQAKWLILAFSIPLVGGITTQVVLPTLGFKIVPLTSTLSTLTVIIVGYAITRYQLMAPALFNIGRKLIIGFVLVALLAGAMGFYSLEQSQITSQRTLGEGSMLLANNVLGEIERNIQARIEILRAYAQESRLREAVARSNQEFAQFEDPYAYIGEVDEEWTKTPKAVINPFMQELIGDELSAHLRDKISFYEREYGYPVYGEVFVTNKYGANVAQTGKTTDYYQADEEWWQITKETGFYWGKVEYDESAGIHSVSIGIRVDDFEGQFIGAMKAVLNIQEALRIITVAGEHSPYSTAEFKLLNGQGEVILDPSGEFNVGQDVSKEKFFEGLIADQGFFLKKGEEGVEELLAYGRSEAKVGSKNLDWILIVEMETRELFAPAYKIRNDLMVTSLGAVLIALLIGLIISRLVTRPILEARDAALEISRGDFTRRIEVATNDEVGQLAAAFNQMADRLEDLYGGLENKVKEKTKELSEKMRMIEKQNKTLEETKKAMLNLLEDARALEEELKREKASVEQKVKERTEQLEDARESISKNWFELQQEKARLISSIDSLSLGFIMTDREGEVVISNPAANRILGGPRGAYAFFTSAAIQEKLEGVLDFNRCLKKCAAKGETMEIKELNFKGRILRVFFTPIIMAKDHGTYLGTVVLFEDITEAKLLERAREEFVALASHELRTPLTAIRGNLALIQQYFSEKMKDKDLREMLADMKESSVRLIKIVNDFLDVSRLEQGRIEFSRESFDLLTVAEEILSEFKAAASQKKIDLRLEQSKIRLPKVTADKERTKQVLINLLDNGLKFTKKGGIVVRVAEAGQFLQVAVADTGIGISKPNQKLLFRKFQQAGDKVLARDVTRGTGMGLYISKLLVEGMGGKIYLKKSEVGNGSTFAFELPIT